MALDYAQAERLREVMEQMMKAHANLPNGRAKDFYDSVVDALVSAWFALTTSNNGPDGPTMRELTEEEREYNERLERLIEAWREWEREIETHDPNAEVEPEIVEGAP